MWKLVGAFNQEKALVGAFSVIVKTDCEIIGARHSTSFYTQQIVGLHNYAVVSEAKNVGY